MRSQDIVADWIAERVAEVLAIDPDTIAWDTPFTELGLPSIQAVELSDDLQVWTGLTLPPSLAYDYPTIEATAAFVAEEAERVGKSLDAASAPKQRTG